MGRWIRTLLLAVLLLTLASGHPPGLACLDLGCWPPRG